MSSKSTCRLDLASNSAISSITQYLGIREWATLTATCSAAPSLQVVKAAEDSDGWTTKRRRGRPKDKGGKAKTKGQPIVDERAGPPQGPTGGEPKKRCVKGFLIPFDEDTPSRQPAIDWLHKTFTCILRAASDQAGGVCKVSPKEWDGLNDPCAVELHAAVARFHQKLIAGGLIEARSDAVYYTSAAYAESFDLLQEINKFADLKFGPARLRMGRRIISSCDRAAVTQSTGDYVAAKNHVLQF